MAVLAIKIATHIIIRVAEAQTKGARCRGCRIVATRPVTRPARRDVNPSRLPIRGMALITGLVRAQACGDCFSDASVRGSMTGRAIRLRLGVARRVLRVIEFGEETAQARKLFERRIRLIKRVGRVADRAHLRIGRGELRQMTIGAVFVFRETRLKRVVAAGVADRATPAPGKRRVRARIRMRESGIILRGRTSSI